MTALLIGCGGSDSPASAPSTAATKAAVTTTAAPSDDSAVEAVKRQFGYLDKGQYDRNWDELHPAQQVIIPRALYVKCVGEALGGVTFTIETGEVRHQRHAIQGTALEVDAVAITVKTTGKSAGFPAQTSTDTFYEVLVGGQWRWTSANADAYKVGDCP